MISGRRGIPEDLRPKMAELAGIDYEALLRREGIISGQVSNSPNAVNVTGSQRVAIGQTDRPHTVEMSEMEFFIWKIYRMVPAEKRREVLEACQLRLMRMVGQLVPE